MRHWSLNLLLCLGVLASCSKPRISQVDDALLIGLYKSESKALTDAVLPYFFITANLDLYTFQDHDGQLLRDYIGTISYDPGLNRITYEYDVEEESFYSNDFEGKKTTKFPTANIEYLVQVNQKALELKRAVGDDYPLELRMKNNIPAHDIKVLAYLDLLIQSADSLKAFLKNKGLKRIWVSDIEKNDIHIEKDRLVIVTSPSITPEEFLDQLNNDPDSISILE